MAIYCILSLHFDLTMKYFEGFVIVKKQIIDVSFLCVCPLHNDDKLNHNIVKLSLL